jgi:glycosyltransferase involved in cell wall biosynthesis
LSRPVRIALVTHGFTVGGGVPAVARWLSHHLRETGEYEVDIHDLATSRRDPESRRVVRPRSWVARSLRGNPGEGPVEHWGANAVELEFMRYRPRRELSKALRGYDLVQVVAGGPAWANVVAGPGRPVILQVATVARWERQSQIAAQRVVARGYRQAMTHLTTALERRALTQVDAVLVENEEMLELVRSVGQPHVSKAPPGVDTEAFTPDPRGWRREGHLLSVCRLGDPRKGLERAILAYAQIVEADAWAPELILAGRGRITDGVVDLIRGLGLGGRVSIRSDVGVPELVELYRGASVFLQTSYEEGLGLSVLEAMACGLPIVATRTAGSTETVAHGKSGWLVEQEGPVAPTLAARIHAVLADGSGEFAAAARRRCVNEFSTGVALGRFTDAYRIALTAADPAPTRS